MKILNLANIAKLTLGLLVVLLVACDKKGSDPAPAPVASYGYVNGACYDTATNTVAAQNLCANVLLNGAYYYDGVTCYDANRNVTSLSLCTSNIGAGGAYRWNGVNCVDINNMPVAQTLCSQTGQYQLRDNNNSCVQYSNGYIITVAYSLCAGVAGYDGNKCHGYFWDYRTYGDIFYTSRQIYCKGSNCSGKTLVDATTNQTRVCP